MDIIELPISTFQVLSKVSAKKEETVTQGLFSQRRLVVTAL
jgi:hypothetical protein